MRGAVSLLVATLLLAAGCAKEFYCEETPDDRGIRYCYARPAECGSRGKDPLADKPRVVTCGKRPGAHCRPDPDDLRVCAASRTECEASIPPGLSDTRTGRPPSCDWIR